MSGPSLQSIRIDPDGDPLRLRVLLPPNLTAGRKTIPVKIETELNGHIHPPEKLSNGPYWLDPPELLAALLIESWCQGKLASMLMLTPDQLCQLLQPLEGQPTVFSFKNPKQPLNWQDGQLPGVHEHLEVKPAAEACPAKPKTEKKKPSHSSRLNPDTETPPLSPLAVDGSSHFVAITLPSRESALYDEALDLVKSYGFRLEPSNRKWWLRDRHKTLQFLAEHWDDLENKYRADFTDNFKERTAHIQRADFAFKAEAKSDGYDIELRLQAPGVDSEQFAQALSKGQGYLEADDKVVLVEKSRLERFNQTVTRLDGNTPRGPRPKLRCRISQAELAFASEALEPLNLDAQTPEEWQRRSGALRDLSNLTPAPLNSQLNDTLRLYQLTGTAWLWHLYQHQLGGILADEMGLGKTLQALGLISVIAAQSDLPCLVVCPASLVENWRREAIKFTPWLKVRAHHGSGRSTGEDAFAGAQLLITSYGTLARDANQFHSQDFACAIGDEAQHVKNRQTQNARALRGLKAGRRFLLTGTPVENSLADLRALFEFILPGYLGKPPPRGTSREERDLDNARLRQRAAPYILRRTKQAVAPELPDKIEQVVYCEFDDAQRSFYQEVETVARKELFEMEMAKASEGKQRMAAFKELLRLRQACIDPRLIDSNQTITSTKLNAFLEILEEALDDAHRILVFSQFTSALAVLREALDGQKTAYLYLDGKTKNRAALCEQFNNDPSIPVFLISLKAGGVGLNLTGADTVVHYDPWWNPAVEAQATDRAHRIGQTKVVTSYKLICPATVEERVLALQKSKAELLKNVFDAADANADAIALADLKELLGQSQ